MDAHYSPSALKELMMEKKKKKKKENQIPPPALPTDPFPPGRITDSLTNYIPKRSLGGGSHQ